MRVAVLLSMPPISWAFLHCKDSPTPLSLQRTYFSNLKIHLKTVEITNMTSKSEESKERPSVTIKERLALLNGAFPIDEAVIGGMSSAHLVYLANSASKHSADRRRLHLLSVI